MINDAGQIAVYYSELFGEVSFRRYDPGEVPVVLALIGTDFLNAAQPVALNESGQVAAFVDNFDLSNSVVRLDYDIDSGLTSIVEIARSSANLFGLTQPVLDDVGTVSFMARQPFDPTEAVFEGDGVVLQIASMPPMGCSSVGIVSGNAAGVVFAQNSGFDSQCLFTVSDGILDTLLPADEDSPFGSSCGSGPAISDTGLLLFCGIDVPGFPQVGGLYTGRNPVADAVIEWGDALFGGFVSDRFDNLRTSRQSINEAGQITFLVEIELPDGGLETHVVRADPTVPPAAPVLTTSGACPGSVTINVDGATPNAGVAIVFAQETGFSAVPSGPCQGVPIDLEEFSLLTVLTADGTGSVVLEADAPPAACEATLQAVELGCCAVSDTAGLP